MLDFLAAIRGLTIRGLCFVATGLACCALAATVGEEDLLRVGVLLVALPVCAAAFVCKTRYRLACHRLLMPARVAVGGAVSVGIRIDNMSGRPSSVLLVDDEVPDPLGFRARFVLDRVEAGGARYFTYQLRPQLRGRHDDRSDGDPDHGSLRALRARAHVPQPRRADRDPAGGGPAPDPSRR
ncbi:hypothetical protein [Frankia sp. Cr1]|uniref:hypothetical protein n=1 Tax=Frankia sp. Cr1 TaxID=3073931 RepID=UPI002AD3A0FE|nr:hypothetical protein [Frankia sp. Cr1]